MLINDLLLRQKDNEKIALWCGQNSITYADWHKKAVFVSNILNQYTNSDNIAIFLNNSIEYAIAYFGILYSNKVIVPLSPNLKEIELLHILLYCEIHIIITSIKYKKLLQLFLYNYNYQVCIIYIEDGTINFFNISKIKVNKVEILPKNKNEDDVAIMLHTSGTSSDPKRVMLTHKNLLSNIKSNIESLKLVSDEITLIALPMYFGYCNTSQFLTHIYLGAAMVIMNNVFSPKSFFQLVSRYKITNFTCVPSMLIIILYYRYWYNYNIDSLKYICFGGSKMPVNKLSDLIYRFPSIGFVQTYGQTEASPRITALMPEDSLRKIGSIGKAIPGLIVKIIDDEGREADTNQIGEIIVKGKNIMKGYYKKNELTNDIVIDGWLYTGDLGYKDEEGYFYLSGRKKNIIISGGINIYPEEIEEIIMGFDNIKDVYVLAESHELLGEVPIAKIILENADRKINLEDLNRYCSTLLSKYKLPVHYEIVEYFEKTYNGKTKRH